MKTVGLNKAEADALLRLDKRSLLNNAIMLENIAIINFIKCMYSHLTDSDLKNIDLTNKHTPFISYSSIRVGRSNVNRSLFLEIISIAVKSFIKNINTENNITFNISDTGIVFNLPVKTKNLSLPENRKSSLSRYLRILNAKSVRNGIPILLSGEIVNVVLEKDNNKINRDNYSFLAISILTEKPGIPSDKKDVSINPYDILSSDQIYTGYPGSSINSILSSNVHSFITEEVIDANYYYYFHNDNEDDKMPSEHLIHIKSLEQIFKTLQRYTSEQ